MPSKHNHNDYHHLRSWHANYNNDDNDRRLAVVIILVEHSGNPQDVVQCEFQMSYEQLQDIDGILNLCRPGWFVPMLKGMLMFMSILGYLHTLHRLDMRMRRFMCARAWQLLRLI
jgi:hypothetical protein